MEEFFKVVSNYGFPIVVAGYLLFRMEDKFDKFTKSIDGEHGLNSKVGKLAENIKALTTKIEKLNRKK